MRMITDRCTHTHMHTCAHTLLRDAHIIEIGAHDRVHDPLAVGAVHHEEGLQLQRRRAQQHCLHDNT